MFSTFFGGNGGELGEKIDVDSFGNCYITGTTDSTNLPTKNAFQAKQIINNNNDAFIAKFTDTGQLVFSSYIGGSNSDHGNSLVVDSTGNSFIIGQTFSEDFPTRNALNNTYLLNGDMFISKFSPSGTLLFSTYYGGKRNDEGTSIAIDKEGNIYITGITESNDIPILIETISTYHGKEDDIVAKFSQKEFSKSNINSTSKIGNDYFSLVVKNFMMPIIVIGTVLVFLLSINLILDYNIEKKLRKKGTKSKFTFKTFLKKKILTYSPSKKEEKKISPKTFDLLEQIEKENRE